MQEVGEVLGKAMMAAAGGEVRVPTSGADMTDSQVDAVAYFYLRLSTIYGTEYLRHYPDENTEAVSKREHGVYVMNYTKAQIDKGMDALHVSRQSGDDKYKWLNIDEAIGLVKSGGNVTGDRVGAYKVFDRKKALTDQTTLARRKKAGRSALDEMLDMVADVKQPKKTVYAECANCGHKQNELLKTCEKCGRKRDD